MTTSKPDLGAPISDPARDPEASPDDPVLERALDAAAPRAIGRRGVLGFLAGASVTAPLAGGLGWMAARSRRAPDAEPAGSAIPTGRGVASALRERPRLVFAVPTEPGALFAERPKDDTLGHAFGEYLNHGSDEQLAPLALVYPEFLDDKDLGEPEPFSLFLVTRTRTERFRFDIPTLGRDLYGEPERTQRLIDQRIAAIANAIRDAVAPDGWLDQVWPDAMNSSPRVAAIAAWAAAGKRVLPATQETVSMRYLPDRPEGEPLPVTPGEVGRYAPGLYAVALRTTGPARADLFTMLAANVRARFVRGAIPGAEWARSESCGAEIEGRDGALGMLCGMGHTPERSQRFLHFYTAGS